MEAQTQTADLKPNIKYVTDNFKYRQLRIFRSCASLYNKTTNKNQTLKYGKSKRYSSINNVNN